MRSTPYALLLASILPCYSAVAEARALPNAQMAMSIEGRRQPGIGLRGDGTGWRLRLAGDARATQVVLVDVTARTHEKWVLPVEAGAILLDGTRFVGGHAYRVEVQRDGALVERGLVYLYPGRGSRTSRIAFENEAVDTSSDDGISVMPKSAL